MKIEIDLHFYLNKNFLVELILSVEEKLEKKTVNNILIDLVDQFVCFSKSRFIFLYM